MAAKPVLSHCSGWVVWSGVCRVLASAWCLRFSSAGALEAKNGHFLPQGGLETCPSLPSPTGAITIWGNSLWEGISTHPGLLVGGTREACCCGTSLRLRAQGPTPHPCTISAQGPLRTNASPLGTRHEDGKHLDVVA